MARVFVSFASADVDVARLLHDRLSADGHQVFLDRDLQTGIQVGEDWKDRLHTELRRVDSVVGLVSRASVASSWCAAELAIADTLGCRLLPVRLEPGVVHPFLDHLQYADYAADPEHAIALLRQSVRTLVPPTPSGTDGNPFPGLEPFTEALAARNGAARAWIRAPTSSTCRR